MSLVTSMITKWTRLKTTITNKGKPNEDSYSSEMKVWFTLVMQYSAFHYFSAIPCISLSRSQMPLQSVIIVISTLLQMVSTIQFSCLCHWRILSFLWILLNPMKHNSRIVCLSNSRLSASSRTSLLPRWGFFFEPSYEHSQTVYSPALY